jgi:hypothetical protein
VRISDFTWDPEQPGQNLDGLSQYPCAGARDPCPTGSGFIGDYFALAISAHNIYALMVSTHYPSNVAADEGGPIYYQQQVLATVPRAAASASATDAQRAGQHLPGPLPQPLDAAGGRWFPGVVPPASRSPAGRQSADATGETQPRVAPPAPAATAPTDRVCAHLKGVKIGFT